MSDIRQTDLMDDMISKNTALDALCDNCNTVDAVCAHIPCKRYLSIENLQPVQPESKRKWYMKGYRDAQQKILRWVKENERGQDENI